LAETDEQQVTDEEEPPEPWCSMKFAIQDRIFMARLCELGERPEDMLEFLLQAI